MPFVSTRGRTVAGIASALCLFGMILIAASPFCLASGPGAVPCQSGPVALSRDGRHLVNVNPQANTLTVFNVVGSALFNVGQIPVGGDPSSVAISPDSRLAYVANALGGT